MQSNTDGSWTVLPVKVDEGKGKFPPGSLLKYMTPERDKEEAKAVEAFVHGPE